MSRFHKIISLILTLVLLCAAVPFASAENTEPLELELNRLAYISNQAEAEYLFHVAKAGNYVLETDYSWKGQEADTVLYVYDQNHNLIGMNDDIYTSVAQLQNGFSMFRRYLEAGTYYVKVTGKDNALLYCSLRYSCTDDCEVFDFGTNKKISFTEGLLYKEYKINLDNSKNALIETSFYERFRDTGIKLYDDCHNLVASNDDIDNAGNNLYSKVDTYLGAGVYYLKLVVYRPSNESLGCNVSFNSPYTPYAYITAPKEQGYILQGESWTFDVNASSYTNAITLDYVINGTAVSVADNFTWNDRKNCFTVTAPITQEMFDYPSKVNGEYPFPKFRATAATQVGSAVAEIDGYITILTRSQYSGKDSSWFYMDEINNSFEGFASEDYNCMAYALGVTDQWIWPWSVGYPDFEPVCYFFNKSYSYATRPGDKFTELSETPFAYPQLLFYSGHVMKVTKWDEDGNAIEGLSKWGRSELIRSNPQTGMNAWGEVMVYIKGRVEE